MMATLGCLILALLVAGGVALWLDLRALRADHDALRTELSMVRDTMRRFFEAAPSGTATPGRAAIRAHITRRLERAIAARQRHT